MYWIVFLYCLAEIESGNDPNAIGKEGEVTRYQISKIAIIEYNSLFHTKITAEQLVKDEDLAYEFTKRLLHKLGDRYYWNEKIQPTPFIYALMWKHHYPYDPKTLDLERADRINKIYYLNRVKK